MNRSEQRRAAAAEWAAGYSQDCGLPIDDPECAVARAAELLDLVETCYRTVQVLADDGAPELGSLAAVVEALEDHHDRMVESASLARGSGPYLRSVRDPD